MKTLFARLFWIGCIVAALALMLLMNYHQLFPYRPQPRVGLVQAGADAYMMTSHGTHVKPLESIANPAIYELPEGTEVTYYDPTRAEATLPDGRFVRGTLHWNNQDVDVLKTAEGETISLAVSKPYSNWSKGLYFISVKGLRKSFIGKTFEEIDGKYRIADDYSPLADNKAVAYFNRIAMITENGNYMRTAVWFGSDGRCDSISYTYRINGGNLWWLKMPPGVQTIMGNDLLTWFVQEAPYGVNKPECGWFFNIFYYVAWWLLVLLWVALPMVLPAAIYNTVLPIKRLHMLPLVVIAAPAILLTIAWSYIWMIATIAWGVYWWVAVPLSIITILYVAAFSLAVPSTLRCPKCGHVDTYHLTNSIYSHTLTENVHAENELGIDHKEYLRTITREESEVEEGEVIDSKGIKIADPKLYRLYECTYKVYAVYYKYEKYINTYTTKIYNDYYKCSHCGFKDQKERKGERVFVTSVNDGQVVRRKKEEEVLVNSELIKEEFYENRKY